MAKPYIITVLDIGSSFIKILSVLKKPGEDGFEVLGRSQAVSSGIRRGVVIDASKVAGIISSLVREIEQKSGRKIENVYFNVGGSHIFSTSSRGLVSVSRADRKISEEDVARVIQAAQTCPLPSNKEILEVFPKEFIVDKEGGIKEAIGMEGVRLETDCLLLCGFSPYLRNSNQAILDAGLSINYLVATPLASARAVLTSREKELGVCVLDIGAGTTSMSVFEEGNLIHVAVFPIGSGHITNDIAVLLRTDIDTAERIKIEFGTCKNFPPEEKKSKKEKKITVEGEEPIVFSKKMLADIIEARVSEIFELVNKELKKISRQGQLPAGVVLTGGGAKIPGIKELAKKELKLPVRIGLPFGISDFEQDTSLATLYGLVFEAIDLEEGEDSRSDFGRGIIGLIKKIIGAFIP